MSGNNPGLSTLNNPQNAELLRSLEASYRASSAVRPAGLPNLPAGTSFRQAVQRIRWANLLIIALNALGIQLPSEQPNTVPPEPISNNGQRPAYRPQLRTVAPNSLVSMVLSAYNPGTGNIETLYVPGNHPTATGKTPVSNPRVFLVHPRFGWSISDSTFVQVPNNESWRVVSDFIGGTTNTYHSLVTPNASYNWVRVSHYIVHTNLVYYNDPINPIGVNPPQAFLPSPVINPVVPSTPIPQEPVTEPPIPPQQPDREPLPPPLSVPFAYPRPRSPSWDNPGRTITPQTPTIPSTPSRPTPVAIPIRLPTTTVPSRSPIPRPARTHPRVPQYEPAPTPIPTQPSPQPLEVPNPVMPPIGQPVPVNVPTTVTPAPVTSTPPTTPPPPTIPPIGGTNPCSSAGGCQSAMYDQMGNALAQLAAMLLALNALSNNNGSGEPSEVNLDEVLNKLGRRTNLSVEDMVDHQIRNIALTNQLALFSSSTALHNSFHLSKGASNDISSIYNSLNNSLSNNLTFIDSSQVPMSGFSSESTTSQASSSIGLSSSGAMPETMAQNSRLAIFASNFYHDSISNLATLKKSLDYIIKILTSWNNTWTKTGKISTLENNLISPDVVVSNPLLDTFGLGDNDSPTGSLPDYHDFSVNELKTSTQTRNTVNQISDNFEQDINTSTETIIQEHQEYQQASVAGEITEQDMYSPNL